MASKAKAHFKLNRSRIFFRLVAESASTTTNSLQTPIHFSFNLEPLNFKTPMHQPMITPSPRILEVMETSISWVLPTGPSMRPTVAEIFSS